MWKRQNLHVLPGQCLVDGASLDFGHCLQPHLLRDGVDDIGVYQSTCRQPFESGDWPIFRSFPWLLFDCCDLSPLRALVKCGDGAVIYSQCGRPYYEQRP